MQNLAGLNIDCATRNRSTVHIQTNEITIDPQLGPPKVQLWIGQPCKAGNPPIFERRAQPQGPNTLISLAQRAAALDEELKEITKRINKLVRRSPAAALLHEPGIGPITAAVALTAWSHLGRIRSESVFASLAGVTPIPVSSRNTVQQRINSRRRTTPQPRTAHSPRHPLRVDPRARAYVERRTAEGRTLREIRQCLKRYLVREIYRVRSAAQLDQAAA